MTDQVWWYATRAAGLMTWSTAMASVLLGLLLSTRLLGKRPNGPWLLDVHRFLGGLSALFLVVHLVSIWADSYVDFGARELLVPGASDWNPDADLYGVSAVTLGILAAYALIAVEITSIVRKHIRPAIWKGVHYLSIVTVVAGTLHGWRAGTDVDNPVVIATAVGSSILVVLLALVRVSNAHVPEPASDRERVLEEVLDRLDSLPSEPQGAEPRFAAESAPDLPQRPLGGLDEPATQPISQAPTPVPPPVGAPPVPPPVPTQIPYDEPQFQQSLVPPDESPGPEPSVVETGQPAQQPTATTGPPAEQTFPLGADPFEGLQAADDDFDPGGWSRESSAAGPTASGESLLPPPPPPPVFETPNTEQTPPAPPPPPPPAPGPEGATGPERDEPDQASADTSQLDPWEDALESLLASLPQLPRYQPPQPPEPVVDPSGTDTGSPEANLPSRAQPIVEPVEPPPVVQPAAPVEPPPLPQRGAPVESPPLSRPAPVDTAHTAGGGEAPGATSPPPLPITAVDPVSGEPDEDAYKTWLVEWLQYAERYGDETPIDPTRVES